MYFGGIPDVQISGFLDSKICRFSHSRFTDYPHKQVRLTVPANGVAYASFDYSDLPPGDARLKVTLDVIGTPTHEDSQTSEIITIKFSNMADEDGESDWLVIVIILLTGLVLYGGFKTAKKGSSGRF